MNNCVCGPEFGPLENGVCRKCGTDVAFLTRIENSPAMQNARRVNREISASQTRLFSDWRGAEVVEEEAHAINSDRNPG